MTPYNPKNWYWIVIDDSNQVFSGLKDTYVSPDDQGLSEWQALGNMPTLITKRDLTIIRIELLEQQQTPRRVREAITVNQDWIMALEDKIANLRSTL